MLWISKGHGISFFLKDQASISHLKKSFVNVFDSVKVGNVTVTSAISKYTYILYELIKKFLYILRNFYKFY